LTNLESLFLSDNQLTGGIPSELGNLRKMKHLFLENNQLSGRVPGALVNARQILLPGNCDMTGNPDLCQSAGPSSKVAGACKGDKMIRTCQDDIPFQTPVASDSCDTGKFRNPADMETIKGSCITKKRCNESGRQTVSRKCMKPGQRYDLCCY
jgi:hypothetical protein